MPEIRKPSTVLARKKRLLQMGELEDTVFITGSPDVDLILSKNLPSLSVVKKRYDINFSSFVLAIFHPITTDIKNLKFQIRILTRIFF